MRHKIIYVIEELQVVCLHQIDLLMLNFSKTFDTACMVPSMLINKLKYVLAAIMGISAS